MINRTVSEIAEMVGALAWQGSDADARIEGVSIDTRTLKRNNLFVPIVGDRFNGHHYVQAAITGGVSAVLWNQDEPNPPDNIAVIFVEDTLAAIQRLAQAYRSELNTYVVGITGSNGKTSTKDILASILSTAFKTQKTQGNLNNHLGVPLTLLSLEGNTQFAVVEMGMSGLGEIAQLAKIAQLDAAIITNVSEVHLGDLKTRERIAQAKLEIIRGLKPGGLFVYNGDHPLLSVPAPALAAHFERVTFGQSPTNDLFPLETVMDETGISFTVSNPSCPHLSMPLLGRHQTVNVLAAIAVARAVGLPYKYIQAGLQQVELTGMRNELIQTDRCTIINDSYKSNPTSLRAALDILYSLQPYTQKIVLLSEMVELGEESAALHREIGRELDPKQIDFVFTIGPMTEHLAETAKTRFEANRVIVCAEQDELTAQLQGIIQDGSLILIKGSRKFELERVVEALKRETGVNAS